MNAERSWTRRMISLIAAFLMTLGVLSPGIAIAEEKQSYLVEGSGLLSYGSTGEEVLQLQTALSELGYLSDGYTAGSYDVSTVKAVTIFQVFNGLAAPDGICGSWTRRKLAEGAEPFHVMQRGEQSIAAEWVQKLLEERGFLTVRPDGWWGAYSGGAIALLQTYYELEVTGEPDLWALYDLTDTDGARVVGYKDRYSIGDTAEDIRRIRMRLYQYGFGDPGTGSDFDTDLLDSVTIYQAMAGIVPDGIIGPLTNGWLNSGAVTFDTLAYGSSGESVRTLQRVLKESGLLSAEPDGRFGQKTLTAVLQLQRYAGLEDTGMMDLSSWQAMLGRKRSIEGFGIGPGEVLGKGSGGPGVAFLQQYLYDLGYVPFQPDTLFGKKTEAGLRLFQQVNGISADGLCGLVTVNNMISPAVQPFSALAYGDRGDLVLVFQQRLAYMGYLRVQPDGIFGSMTRQAVMSFQSDAGLEATGSIGCETAVPLLSVSRSFVAAGIDVSSFNGGIDWAKVRAAGIEFAFIRAGGRFGGSGKIYTDSSRITNILGANQNGIPVGLYFYTQAISAAEAREEADFLCDLADGYDISLPLVYDMEILGDGRADGLSVSRRTEIARAFCSEVEARGYRPMLYSYTAFLQDNIDMSRLAEYDLWVAQYHTQVTYEGPYQYWQHSESGRIDGIGYAVDLDWKIGYR